MKTLSRNEALTIAAGVMRASDCQTCAGTLSVPTTLCDLILNGDPNSVWLSSSIIKVTDALLTAINTPLAPGVEWDSREFWGAFRGDYAAVNSDGSIHGSLNKPTRGASQWVSAGNLHWIMTNFHILDRPSVEFWKDSLIHRPST